ncbi:hypothetical protein TREMEDRAFT_68017 [Tremella mesenterica DSM 1558]|uniref:uncharacterized protein n=1 Tax=Tremella mesenterica (strain ATCC 24925 / CBS 8224 / DSM 1558 / NBRC 9311 / NRRL Y-6157 / RJB 2259-6 / UBC 559-6) TaxID=578456 RepID=UPI0003F4A3C1|nr:uncharacterized protein TREMEDRAFT_68017 [Tremella mesenterica DSM 1558]EIW70363.1 hypothetical protein TREMEDRAFT_68017 [Tremella mesenterica DSM 1558]
MVSSPSPAPSITSDEADGYLLLSIPNVTVKQVYQGESMILARGEMRLECISLPITNEQGKQTANPFSPSPSDPSVPTHDHWLVLRVSTFEMPLIPSSPILPSSNVEGIAYILSSQHIPDAALHLIFSSPRSIAEYEDLDSFEILLRQYGSLGEKATALEGVQVGPAGSTSNNLGITGTGSVGLKTQGKDEDNSEGLRRRTGKGTQGELMDLDMRGKVVLVNEETGEVVGELDHRLDVQEGQGVASGGKDKPVMLDFGDVLDEYAPKVVVQTVPQEEMDDWMLRGAHNISKGILTFGAWSSRMINNSAENFIKNTTPSKEPVKFGPSTKAGVRMAHNASVRTVKVTKSTVGMINNVSLGYEKGYQPMQELYQEYRNSSPSLDKPSSSTISNNPNISTPVKSNPSSKPPTPIPIPTTSYVPRQSPRGTPSMLAPIPKLPPRSRSPLNNPRTAPLIQISTPDHIGQKVSIPSTTESLLAQEKTASSTTKTPSSAPAILSNGDGAGEGSHKRPFLNKLLLAGEVVLTSLEATAHELIDVGTAAASSAAGHKFGPEAGKATALVGGSVRNVAVVYIDVRGVGRRALLKSTAKGFVKARLKNGETVQLQGVGQVGRGEQGVVVGMQEVQRKVD